MLPRRHVVVGQRIFKPVHARVCRALEECQRIGESKARVAINHQPRAFSDSRAYGLHAFNAKCERLTARFGLAISACQAVEGGEFYCVETVVDLAFARTANPSGVRSRVPRLILAYNLIAVRNVGPNKRCSGNPTRWARRSHKA